MARLACPSINGLKLLIKEAFNEISSAETGRLQAIEATLIGQLAPARRSLRRSLFGPLPAWILLLMLGAGTATAWWAGNAVIEWLSGDGPKDAPARVVPPPAVTEPETPPKQTDKQAEKPSPGSTDVPPDSSIIYQREVY